MATVKELSSIIRPVDYYVGIQLTRGIPFISLNGFPLPDDGVDNLPFFGGSGFNLIESLLDLLYLLTRESAGDCHIGINLHQNAPFSVTIEGDRGVELLSNWDTDAELFSQEILQTVRSFLDNYGSILSAYENLPTIPVYYQSASSLSELTDSVFCSAP